MKKHGWVIQMKKDCTCGKENQFYVGIKAPEYSSAQIKKAGVYENRWLARMCANQEERVCKVSLYKNGKAKKIIGRG